MATGSVWPCLPSEAACVTKVGIPVRFDPSARHAFWWRTKYPTWEESTFQIFRYFVRPDSVVLDVGGWIGSTSLWLAALAQKVVVLEPSDAAFEELVQNAAQNADRRDRLSLLRVALGARRGFVQMTNRGDSADQVGIYDGRQAILSTVWDLRELLLAFPILNETSFIKIDAEGSERDLVPSMASFLHRTRPTVWLSLHPYALTVEEMTGLVALLKEMCPFLYGLRWNITWALTDFRITGRMVDRMPQVADSADDALCLFSPAPRELLAH
ncbi:unnamed protein product [Symbiodinium natans]|uniref:Methyltransferase FkbM domain-containing protein n=1 Tax=Symbiodinium natans TaxID=878477 RepID=A0A812PEU3_9DINO|nr:unnamed protein product [Symbiodinium natans]